MHVNHSCLSTRQLGSLLLRKQTAQRRSLRNRACQSKKIPLKLLLRNTPGGFKKKKINQFGKGGGKEFPLEKILARFSLEKFMLVFLIPEKSCFTRKIKKRFHSHIPRQRNSTVKVSSDFPGPSDLWRKMLKRSVSQGCLCSMSTNKLQAVHPPFLSQSVIHGASHAPTWQDCCVQG